MIETLHDLSRHLEAEVGQPEARRVTASVARSNPKQVPAATVPYSLATRRCGRCSATHKITTGQGSKHRMWGWICKTCTEQTSKKNDSHR